MKNRAKKGLKFGTIEGLTPKTILLKFSYKERKMLMYNIVIYEEDKKIIRKIKKCISNIGISKLDVKYFEFGENDKLLDKLKQISNLHILFMGSNSKYNYMIDTIKETYPEMIVIQQTEVVEELTSHLRTVFEQIDTMLDIPYIVGHHRKKYIRVKVKNILYVKKEKRGCRVYVNPYAKEFELGDKIMVDSSLGDLLKYFNDSEYKFAVSYNGYLINLNHVVMINGKKVKLDTGDELPISRTYHSDFQSRFVAYYKKYKPKS